MTFLVNHNVVHQDTRGCERLDTTFGQVLTVLMNET